MSFARSWTTCIGKKARYLIVTVAVCLSFAAPNPCVAISAKIASFDPATPAETARWVKLLGLENEVGVRVKSMDIRLHEVTVSITRVESKMCRGDICPTFFKYEMDRIFEFIIPCKEVVVIFDILNKDASGRFFVDFGLDIGSSLSTEVKPTSFGPVVTTMRRLL